SCSLRFFRVVDDEIFDRPFRRFQSQPKLFLNIAEDRFPPEEGLLDVLDTLGLRLQYIQREIESALDIRHIAHGAVDGGHHGEELRQRLHRVTLEHEAGSRWNHALSDLFRWVEVFGPILSDDQSKDR